MGETPLALILPLRGEIGRTSWRLPTAMSFDEWRAAGQLLGKIEHAVSWWIGDWWAYGEHRYGDRKAVVGADDWEGPSFKTCANCGIVADSFEGSRRREVLSFTHHAEVAGLSAADADELLDAAEAKGWSTRQLRAEVSKLRSRIGLVPSGATCTVDDLYALIAAGHRYGCIYADPPWLYDNQGTRSATGKKYEGLTVEELCALPIGKLTADAAHLHLWTTNGFLFEAPKIFAAWGFDFRSSFVWVKSKSASAITGAMPTNFCLQQCAAMQDGSPTTMSNRG